MASTLVPTTYVHVLHGRQLRRVHVRPSVTEPGNEGYRRIYPLKIFRWYSQTTKNLHPNILQHDPIYGISRVSYTGNKTSVYVRSAHASLITVYKQAVLIPYR